MGKHKISTDLKTNGNTLSVRKESTKVKKTHAVKRELLKSKKAKGKKIAPRSASPKRAKRNRNAPEIEIVTLGPRKKPKWKNVAPSEIELITVSSSSETDSDIVIIDDSITQGEQKPNFRFQCSVNHSETFQWSNEVIHDSEVLSNEHCISSKASEHCYSVIQKTEVCSAKLQENESSCSSAKRAEGTGFEITSGRKRTVKGTLSKQPSGIHIRNWGTSKFGKTMENQGNTKPNYLMFNVLSYNVLSQSIMEEHPYLYTENNPIALEWNYRSELLFKEFQYFDAEILCLQEVQESHMRSFYDRLHSLGYIGLYKQRTGNKVDGVAIYFKTSTFQLIDYTSVEYYQPGISVLNRDNVGLVVKLAPLKKPDERIVVATTHLLFNPRRHDVKLAQIQVLLAEIDRFAFRGFDPSTGSSMYWPVILTGDMNFEPNTGEFQLLNLGWFQYEGRDNRTLVWGAGRPLYKELLPPLLGVTDTCQHWDIVLQRHIGNSTKEAQSHSAEIPLIKLYNSDFKRSLPQGSPINKLLEDKTGVLLNCDCGFGTGQLSHTLNLNSVYCHDPNDPIKTQVSTFQDDWVVVDYIFYSQIWHAPTQSRKEGNLKLVARYKMLNAEEAEAQGPIPNLISPSDHYPLAAKFALVF